MDHSQENIIKFKDNTKYKIGAVTYDVTAHFYPMATPLDNSTKTQQRTKVLAEPSFVYDEIDTLKSKVSTLLTENINKASILKTVASSHSNVVQ